MTIRRSGRIASVALAVAAISIVTPGAANAATTELPGATLPSACVALATSSTGDPVNLGYCPAGTTPTVLPFLKTCLELPIFGGRGGIGYCP